MRIVSFFFSILCLLPTSILAVRREPIPEGTPLPHEEIGLDLARIVPSLDLAKKRELIHLHYRKGISAAKACKMIGFNPNSAHNFFRQYRNALVVGNKDALALAQKEEEMELLELHNMRQMSPSERFNKFAPLVLHLYKAKKNTCENENLLITELSQRFNLSATNIASIIRLHKANEGDEIPTISTGISDKTKAWILKLRRDGLTHAEIAQKLQIHVSSVRSIYSRLFKESDKYKAIHELADQLDANEENSESPDVEESKKKVIVNSDAELRITKAKRRELIVREFKKRFTPETDEVELVAQIAKEFQVSSAFVDTLTRPIRRDIEVQGQPKKRKLITQEVREAAFKMRDEGAPWSEISEKFGIKYVTLAAMYSKRKRARRESSEPASETAGSSQIGSKSSGNSDEMEDAFESLEDLTDIPVDDDLLGETRWETPQDMFDFMNENDQNLDLVFNYK